MKCASTRKSTKKNIAASTALTMLSLWALTTIAQQKGVVPQHLPEKWQVKILRAEKHQADLRSEWTNLQQRAKEIPQEFNATQMEINNDIKSGLTEMGFNLEKYTADPDSFEIKEIPAPPAKVEAKPGTPEPPKTEPPKQNELPKQDKPQ